jgi:hypothetical protein
MWSCAIQHSVLQNLSSGAPKQNQQKPVLSSTTTHLPVPKPNNPIQNKSKTISNLRAAFGPVRSVPFQFNRATLDPKTRRAALGPRKYVEVKAGFYYFLLANTGPAFYT